MNNIIKLTGWSRTVGRLRGQACGGHKDGKTTHPAVPSSYEVIVVFDRGQLSFSLSRGETFADLASYLEQLGERHSGAPVAVYLKPGMARQSASTLRPGI
mgnify:CR=1 FL=1